MATKTFPAVRFTESATPLQHLPRLSAHLGGPAIFIKRDDMTGLAGGGNKARKLEYLAADALAKGADTLIGLGATQSNHARQTAAAAARLGLHCVLLLERRLEGQPEEYYRAGNALLNRVLGATLCDELPAGADIARAVTQLQEKLVKQGRKPYVVPGGGSNALGAMGYARCIEELQSQARDLGIGIDAIVHAGSSGGTQAGLVAGLGAHRGTLVRSYSVRLEAALQINIVRKIAEETAEMLSGSAENFCPIDVDDSQIGPGYGIPTVEALDAIRLLGRLEGILLDPVYTGKAMAGLISDINTARFSSGQNIVFLHTGGATALSAYASWL
ncbi:D-cysteine desulfhydrase family protein [Paraburkholderia sp. J12]|uniref:D-cysteine desulfhydrase family protein n=1 Tax=Paraburkholderia sp. J12 TaxID=2805432 RepID=UPI002ABDEB06|nr:D-cysteine desulfhydrase family protein [Paraburkholderia sp. J12]